MTVIDNLPDSEAYQQSRARLKAKALPIAKTLLQNAGYATLVYPWKDAPDVFRALSENGGDEDFVIVSRGDVWWAYKLAVCDEDVYDVGDGIYVTITAHS